MKFKDFEDVISAARMRRYVNACGGNVQKGMTLYRYNLSLSGELLKIIGCFEVALRNRIDRRWNRIWAMTGFATVVFQAVSSIIPERRER